MTDAEIRAELDRQIKGHRAVRIDSPAFGPPLIMVARTRLKPDTIAYIRECWEDMWKRDSPAPKLMIVEDGNEIFQLVDGEWRKLD